MRKTIRNLHRYIGIISAAFVIVLSITGLMLQHTEKLSLDQKFLSIDWILDRYQIGHNPIQTYPAGPHHVSQAGDFLYIDGKSAQRFDQDLVGAILFKDGIVVASRNKLTLLDIDGSLIDEIDLLSGLPEKPLGIAIDPNGHPILRGVNTYWWGTLDLVDWQPLRGPHPDWVAPVETPDSMTAEINQHNRSHEISWERVVLDLHSGRLFGQAGAYVVDASAILFIVLALSGIILWSRRR